MEWFLINENEHLGPFSQEVIHEMYHSGEILKKSLLWREGFDDAKSYENIFLDGEAKFKPIASGLEHVYDSPPPHFIIKDEDLPPDLPVEALSFKNKTDQIKLSVNEKKQVANQPVAEATHNQQETDVEEDFDSNDDVATSEKGLAKLLRRVFIIILALLVIAVFFIYLSKQDKSFPRARSMSLENFETLSQTAADESSDLKFSFSLAKDKRTLWIATNIALEGEVFVNLKGKPGKTLGDLVEIKAKGILKQRLISLSEFQFIQGTKFVDGYYAAELYTVNDLQKPFLDRFFKPGEKQFRYANDVLITSLRPGEFEKQLERKNLKRNSNENRFWEKLNEEYKTVKGITTGIKEEVEALFLKPKENWLQSIKNFEESYKSKYGIFFTSFVINVDKQFEVLSAKEFPNKTKIISHYTKLKKLAIEIGEESITVMENLKSESMTSMTNEQIQELQTKSLVKYQLIISECNEMINQL